MSLFVGENDKKRHTKNKNDINNIKKRKIQQQIKTLNNNIKTKKKTLKMKNIELLEIELENEKNSYKNKLLTLKEQYNFVTQKYKKRIQSLKIKVINCEKKFISKKMFDEDINNEDLNFQTNKEKTLAELIEYRRLLSDTNMNDENNEEYSNIIRDNTSNEKTIKEDSLMNYNKLDSLISDKDSFLDEIKINDIKYINIKKKMSDFQKKYQEDTIKVK